METPSDTKKPMPGAVVNSRPETGHNSRKVDYYRDWYTQNNGIKSGQKQTDYLPWFGVGNDETEYIAHVLENNPILPGILSTKASILHSLGLAMFDESKLDEDGNPTLVPFTGWGLEISNFFEANDLEGWSIQTLTYFFHSGNAFTDMVFSADSTKVLKIERIAWETVLKRKPITGQPLTYGICGNWKHKLSDDINPVVDVPGFQRQDFYETGRNDLKSTSPHKRMIWHFRLHSGHRPHYGIAPWYGARHWAEVQNMVPIFHKAALHNQFGGRMAIEVMRDWINQLCNVPIGYDEDGAPIMPTELEVMEKLNSQYGAYLHNPENVGKSVMVPVTSNERGESVPMVRFVPIATQSDDEKYVRLDTQMNNAVTSSMGTSPNLAGIVLPGSLGSGTEMRLSWNVEVGKSGPIRHTILKCLNFVHRFNRWPENWVWKYQDITMASTDIKRDGMVNDSNPANPDSNAV